MLSLIRIDIICLITCHGNRSGPMLNETPALLIHAVVISWTRQLLMSTHFVWIFKCCCIFLNFDVVETAIPRICELIWWKCTRGTIPPVVWILSSKTASCCLLYELMFLQVLVVIINDFLTLEVHQCERFVKLVLICLAIMLDLSLLLCNCLLDFSCILLIARGFKLIDQNKIWLHICLALLKCCIYHLLLRF